MSQHLCKSCAFPLEREYTYHGAVRYPTGFMVCRKCSGRVEIKTITNEGNMEEEGSVPINE